MSGSGLPQAQASPDVERALTMLRRFETEDELLPVEAEKLVADILRACGHTVIEQGFADSGQGVDCFFDADVDGRRQRIAVEVKFLRYPAREQSVEQAFNLHRSGHFDRAMVIARSGFSPAAIRLAETTALGQIDLFAPSDLRNWIAQFRQTREKEPRGAAIIRRAMEDLAKLIAEDPSELPQTEWRDLERVLGAALRGLGFEVHVTRPGKDGGFDLEVRDTQAPDGAIYLVEVKHWTDQKPGSAHLRKLVRVRAAKNATAALLLSTSGFTSTIYSGIAEFTAPVRLADGAKVISICRAYYRLSSGLFLEAHDLHSTLFADTSALGEHLKT
jgi:hypothetical protein